MITRPAVSTPSETLFPHTTLCRSRACGLLVAVEDLLAQAEVIVDILQVLVDEPPALVDHALVRVDRAAAHVGGGGRTRRQVERADLALVGVQHVVHAARVGAGEQRIGVDVAAIDEFGSASCRERGCQYVYLSGVAGSLNKKRET